MTQDVLLSQVTEALKDQSERIRTVQSKVDEQILNKQPDASTWSIAQILEHVRLSDKPYLEMIETHLPIESASSSNHPVKFSLIGKFLIRVAGPNGNAPVPKPFIPKPGPYTLEVFDTFFRDQECFIKLAGRVGSQNLSAVRVGNPVVKFLPMNLADCFAIAQHHTERHVRQIEDRIS